MGGPFGGHLLLDLHRPVGALNDAAQEIEGLPVSAAHVEDHGVVGQHPRVTLGHRAVEHLGALDQPRR